MARYTIAAWLPDVDNPANLLPLRVEMHRCFDARGFIIVPKIANAAEAAEAAKAAEHPPQYVTQIIKSSEAEFWPAYQNVLVQHLSEAPHPYLFARFAWAILLRVVKGFIISNTRHIIQLYTTTDENGVTKVEYKAGFHGQKELIKRYGGGGSTGATPTSKRSRAEDDSMESSGEEEDMDDVWDLGDDEERGRKRRQQRLSDESAPGTKPYLPPDVEVSVKEALVQSMAKQQASSKAREAQGDSQKVEMTLRPK